MFGRDEKVSSLRLTAVQYIVLGIFLILAYGLWRLEVVQSEFYASLAEKNRVGLLCCRAMETTRRVCDRDRRCDGTTGSLQ
jgi:cell division protein FtsI/penicillin-binding protein 2